MYALLSPYTYACPITGGDDPAKASYLLEVYGMIVQLCSATLLQGWLKSTLRSTSSTRCEYVYLFEHVYIYWHEHVQVCAFACLTHTTARRHKS